MSVFLCPATHEQLYICLIKTNMIKHISLSVDNSDDDWVCVQRQSLIINWHTISTRFFLFVCEDALMITLHKRQMSAFRFLAFIEGKRGFIGI